MRRTLYPRVSALVGDITEQMVDAIVNAANATLLGGGGVDGAIHRAGGPVILAACREIRRRRYPEGLPTGDAVLTTAGNLPAKKIIHTVGPIYGQEAGQESVLLASCYRRALTLAVEAEQRTIAFPAISTGAYGYPEAEAASIVSRTIADFLATDDSLTEVRLVFYRPEALEIFCRHCRFV